MVILLVALILLALFGMPLFAVLGCIGLLRHLLSAPYPLVPWLVFAIMATFAVAWIAALLGLFE